MSPARNRVFSAKSTKTSSRALQRATSWSGRRRGVARTGAVLGALMLGATATSMQPAAATSSNLAASPNAGAAGNHIAPAAQTYTNPVFSPTFADPSVFRDPLNGLYYAYGTTDQWGTTQASLHILPQLESSNLVSWHFVGDTFRLPGSAPVAGVPVQPAWTGSPFLWAPEVHYIDGQFVMYYTASNTAAGGSAIGVATSSSPTGPWKDSGGPLIAPRPSPTGGYYATIDPHEQVTPTGKRYLYYGSFYGGTFVVPLTSNGLSVLPGSVPTQVAAAGRNEGTFVVFHNGWYYMFDSTGNCCAGPSSNYDEVVSRSRSPLGPFVDRQGIPALDGGGSVVVADNGNSVTGPGGISVVQDASGQYWMALHGVIQSNPYLPSGGATRRPLFMEPMEWGRGGWPVVNHGLGVLTSPQPAPMSHRQLTPSQRNGVSLLRPVLPGRLRRSYSQTFDTNRLGSQWSWINQDRSNWSLTEYPGNLTIDAQPGQFYQTDHSGQNVLLEKAPQGNFVVQTRVALDPSVNYQQAGLILWQNADTWMKLVGESNSGVDETEWAKQTDVTSSVAGFDCGTSYPPHTCPIYGSGFMEPPGFSPAAAAAGGSGIFTWLRLAKVGKDVTAYTSVNGKTWTPGATYNMSGFNSSQPIRIGLVATAAGPTPLPANFSYVHVYRALVPRR